MSFVLHLLNLGFTPNAQNGLKLIPNSEPVLFLLEEG